MVAVGIVKNFVVRVMMEDARLNEGGRVYQFDSGYIVVRRLCGVDKSEYTITSVCIAMLKGIS